mgnify:CR=1 FL=1|tara:strand:- start:932 stop:1660 length:729 start_codon:yes stop_codon:yes gene_type:complete
MEKYKNFDGSQWANDGIENQVFTGFDGSQWANDGSENQVFTGFDGNNNTNQTTQLTEDEVVRVSEIYGTALNYDGMSPNMELVLPENDNSQMPDSDLWFNHPGLFGITWSSKKREANREKDEQAKVNANFPNTGSCAVMTDSLNRLNGELDNLYANSESGSRGARRVNARATKTRERRLASVQSGKDSACAGEEANFQRDAQLTQQLMSQGSTTPTALSPLNIGIGVLLLGGIVFGITRMNK